MPVYYAHVIPEPVTMKRPQNPRINYLTLINLESRIQAFYTGFQIGTRDF
jgi:hypothetical protein